MQPANNVSTQTVELWSDCSVLPLNFDVSSIVCSFEVQRGSTISHFFKKKKKTFAGGGTRAWKGLEDWTGNKLEEDKIMGRQWRCGDKITTPQKRLKDRRKTKEKRIKGFKSKMHKKKETHRQIRKKNAKLETGESRDKQKRTNEKRNSTARVRGWDRKRTFSGSDTDKVETANRFAAPCCLIGPLLHYQPINLKTHPNRLPPTEISVS